MAHEYPPLPDYRSLRDPGSQARKDRIRRAGRALYFSRSPIPLYRDGDPDPAYYKHLGIYAYRRDFLEVFTSLPTGPLEAAEKLEQLRALEHGYPIQVIITAHDSFEVDTPEDLRRLPENTPLL